MRDNREGQGLVGSDPTCWERPSPLVEQMRRQALQVIRVGVTYLPAPVRRMLDTGELLVQLHRLMASMAMQDPLHG